MNPMNSAPGTADFAWIAHYPKGLDWAMPIRPKPLPELVSDAARAFPQNTAITFKGRTTSYAGLAAEIDRVAAGLQALGVGKGTNVGLFLPNTPTFIVYYYAILKTGGTVVNSWCV